MATTTDTATSTSYDAGTATRRPVGEPIESNGSTNKSKGIDSFKLYAQKKYRHVAAVHAQPRTSCLSHDSDAAPSFLGFRNLMVIVLGMFHRASTTLHLGLMSNSHSGVQPPTYD
jgi:diacylglycerol O-acyltransferase-1